MNNSTSDQLIYGEITALEPEFTRDEVPIVIVRGYDLRHRLMKGQKTRTFTNTTDSAIASDIAKEANLKIDIAKEAKPRSMLTRQKSSWNMLYKTIKVIGSF
jgi:hypothetical protein